MKTLFIIPSSLSDGVVKSQVNPLKSPGDMIFFNRALSLSLLKVFLNRDFDRLYVRDVFSFYLALFFKIITLNSSPILYDFRAIVFYECKYKGLNYFHCIFYFISEFLAYFLSGKISAVSHALREELFSTFKIKRHINVFPSCSTSIINNVRPVTSKFLYVGGVSKWQNIEKILNAFKFISENVDGSTLTIVTKDVEVVTALVNSTGLDDSLVNIISLNNDEVLDFSKDFDFGLIFRDESVVNKVASPIKLSEYICAGLIPVYTGALGDFSDDLNFNSFSIKYTQETFLADYNRIVDCKGVRESIYNYAKNYCWITTNSSNILE